MRVYNVSYDLNRSGQDYTGLIAELKRSPWWWHYLLSTWLIATEETAAQVWNRIAPFVDKNDSVLVIEVVGNHAGWLPKEAWDWINTYVNRRAA